ncbi:hypothetical protein IEO21_09675 [Rhodonia placenta]|uniref:Uncharacterized protein n=1 Tax=Rhodonia placenta TaxID=104341 RepID=A0A8H7NTX3_9APHY|nr:hypothetical protein IEO21_09675 [Postia placenta]
MLWLQIASQIGIGIFTFLVQMQMPNNLYLPQIVGQFIDAAAPNLVYIAEEVVLSFRSSRSSLPAPPTRTSLPPSPITVSCKNIIPWTPTALAVASQPPALVTPVAAPSSVHTTSVSTIEYAFSDKMNWPKDASDSTHHFCPAYLASIAPACHLRPLHLVAVVMAFTMVWGVCALVRFCRSRRRVRKIASQNGLQRYTQSNIVAKLPEIIHGGAPTQSRMSSLDCEGASSAVSCASADWDSFSTTLPPSPSEPTGCDVCNSIEAQGVSYWLGHTVLVCLATLLINVLARRFTPGDAAAYTLAVPMMLWKDHPTPHSCSRFEREDISDLNIPQPSAIHETPAQSPEPSTDGASVQSGPPSSSSSQDTTSLSSFAAALVSQDAPDALDRPQQHIGAHLLPASSPAGPSSPPSASSKSPEPSHLVAPMPETDTSARTMLACERYTKMCAKAVETIKHKSARLDQLRPALVSEREELEAFVEQEVQRAKELQATCQRHCAQLTEAYAETQARRDALSGQLETLKSTRMRLGLERDRARKEQEQRTRKRVQAEKERAVIQAKRMPAEQKRVEVGQMRVQAITDPMELEEQPKALEKECALRKAESRWDQEVRARHLRDQEAQTDEERICKHVAQTDHAERRDAHMDRGDLRELGMATDRTEGAREQDVQTDPADHLRDNEMQTDQELPSEDHGDVLHDVHGEEHLDPEQIDQASGEGEEQAEIDDCHPRNAQDSQGEETIEQAGQVQCVKQVQCVEQVESVAQVEFVEEVMRSLHHEQAYYNESSNCGLDGLPPALLVSLWKDKKPVQQAGQVQCIEQAQLVEEVMQSLHHEQAYYNKSSNCGLDGLPPTLLASLWKDKKPVQQAGKVQCVEQVHLVEQAEHIAQVERVGHSEHVGQGEHVGQVQRVEHPIATILHQPVSSTAGAFNLQQIVPLMQHEQPQHSESSSRGFTFDCPPPRQRPPPVSSWLDAYVQASRSQAVAHTSAPAPASDCASASDDEPALEDEPASVDAPPAEPQPSSPNPPTVPATEPVRPSPSADPNAALKAFWARLPPPQAQDVPSMQVDDVQPQAGHVDMNAMQQPSGTYQFGFNNPRYEVVVHQSNTQASSDESDRPAAPLPSRARRLRPTLSLPSRSRRLQGQRSTAQSLPLGSTAEQPPSNGLD